MKNLIAPFYKNWDDAAYNRYLKHFRLDENKKISDLSKGMRMKFSIALALSHQADLLIMDEPTSGLDPLVREELLTILLKLIQDEHKSVFFSTHITSDLDKVADYILLINDGELLLNIPKDDLLESHAIVKGSLELLTEATKELFISFKQNGYGFEALTNNKAAARRALGAGAVFEKPTLEDIMLFYTRKGNEHAALD